MNKYEWYIGDYDRHEAEKALLLENTVSTIYLKTWDVNSWRKCLETVQNSLQGLFCELTIQSIIQICVIQDETFLVRDCSTKSNAEPYVLVVYYGSRVYNIKVRFLEESQQYALGTGLRGDDVSKIPSIFIVYCFYVTLHKLLILKISYKLSHATNLLFH